MINAFRTHNLCFMSSKLKNIHILRDQNGNQILRYPKNTLLDLIIADLYEGKGIMKYLSCPQFMFCISGDMYPGYREMTQREFNFIKPKFVSDYKNQKIAISKSIKNSRYYLGLDDECLILCRGYAFYDGFPNLDKGYCLHANRLSLYGSWKLEMINSAGPYSHSNIAIILIFDPLCL